MATVVAPFCFAILSASTMSLDEPECDTASATSSLHRCEATITCIWLSEYANALQPARRSL